MTSSEDELDEIMEEVQNLVLAPWHQYSFVLTHSDDDEDRDIVEVIAPEWTLLMTSAFEARGYECDLITCVNNSIKLSYLRDNNEEPMREREVNIVKEGVAVFHI